MANRRLLSASMALVLILGSLTLPGSAVEESGHEHDEDIAVIVEAVAVVEDVVESVETEIGEVTEEPDYYDLYTRPEDFGKLMLTIGEYNIEDYLAAAEESFTITKYYDLNALRNVDQDSGALLIDGDLWYSIDLPDEDADEFETTIYLDFAAAQVLSEDISVVPYANDCGHNNWGAEQTETTYQESSADKHFKFVKTFYLCKTSGCGIMKSRTEPSLDYHNPSTTTSTDCSYSRTKTETKCSKCDYGKHSVGDGAPIGTEQCDSDCGEYFDDFIENEDVEPVALPPDENE